MPHEQVSALNQLAAELAKQPLLSGPVEVNDDVAAEDGISWLGQGKFLHQIHLPEFDQAHVIPAPPGRARNRGG